MILVAINDFLEVPFYSKKIIYRFKKKKKLILDVLLSVYPNSHSFYTTCLALLLSSSCLTWPPPLDVLAM